MNFLDMSKDDLDYYNKIRKRDDDLNWLIKNLAIFAIGFVAVAIMMEFL